MNTFWNARLAYAGLGMLLSVLPVKAATIEITIEKLKFTPEVVNVALGDTVTWINKDNMAHTASVDGGFDVTIPQRKSASTVITSAASIDYHCRFHPNMHGRLDVAK